MVAEPAVDLALNSLYVCMRARWSLTLLGGLFHLGYRETSGKVLGRLRQRSSGRMRAAEATAMKQMDSVEDRFKRNLTNKGYGL